MRAGRSAIGPITDHAAARPEGPHRRGDQAAPRSWHRPQAPDHHGPLQPACGASRRARRCATPASWSTTANTDADRRHRRHRHLRRRDASRRITAACWSRGRPRADVFSVPRVMPGAPAGQVSMDVRPARPGVRRHLGLRLVQPRLRVGGRPAAARPRRRHARRRHRRAAGLWRPQGLGGAARCWPATPAGRSRPTATGW